MGEETTVKIGEQMDMDILEAERTGCGGDPDEKWEKEGNKYDLLRSGSDNSGNGGPCSEKTGEGEAEVER